MFGGVYEELIAGAAELLRAHILQKETLPAAYSRLLGRLLVMRTGALTQSAVLPRGVAMRMFVHPQPVVLQVIIRHDNRQHWGPSASPG